MLSVQLLWDSRLCHGNTPPASSPQGDTDPDRQPSQGRVAFAICYGPVEHRSPRVHKEVVVSVVTAHTPTHPHTHDSQFRAPFHQALLKGIAGIRTTHHPGIMLAHDKHGSQHTNPP